jgi:glucosamine--fructose-6-phosphate aminotransferase (isomerizing)
MMMQDLMTTPVSTATKMHREAAEAGHAVERFLGTNRAALRSLGGRLRDISPTSVTTCARGSSDHAATYAKYMIETSLGIPVSSAALSVTSVYASPLAPSPGVLCVAISQSGRSPDLLAAVRAHRDAGALTVALVNDDQSPLAETADVTLPLMAGPERSVAATKSYIASLAGIAAVVGQWTGDGALQHAIEHLPTMLRQAFELDWQPRLPLVDQSPSLFVIGRGYGLAIAQEAALKLKETCGLHAEAFSAAEVRHGPMAIVGADFPVLGFATSDEAGDDVRSAAAEFRTRGSAVAIADPKGGQGTLAAIATLPAIEPILMIQSFYRYVNELSLARGLDPDRPPHLSKVTATR